MEQLQKTRNELKIEHTKLRHQYSKMMKKIHTKSKSKTRVERIQDKVKQEIELEKISNRVEILSKTIDALDTNISLSKYNISLISIDPEATPEKTNKELLELLESEYKKIDALTTKMFLIKEFKTERLKGINKYDFGPYPLFGGLISTIAIGMPINDILNLPSTLTNLVLTLIIPWLAGAGITILAMTKEINNRIKAFDNLNDQLGEEALTRESNDFIEEYYILEKLLDKKMNDIMIIIMNQKECQRLIEQSQKNSRREKNLSSDKDILFQDFPELHITKETRQEVLEHPELHSGLSVRERMGKFYTDEEWEARRETVLSRPLPGEEKNSQPLVRKKSPRKQ